MDRRNFLRTTGTVIAGATLAHGALAESPQQGNDSVAGGRLILPINRNWRYSPKFVEGAHDKTFDDAAFHDRLARAVVSQHRPLQLVQSLTQLAQGATGLLAVTTALVIVNPLLLPLNALGFLALSLGKWEHAAPNDISQLAAGASALTGCNRSVPCR